MLWANEIDPYCAAWLRTLYPEATIDERSITTLTGADLPAGGRLHFFAGIGGWEYACQLAGWPDDLPLWTGSCPCQPFSSAGRAGGLGDARHLWPAFHRLIAECRPAIVVGEQVASRAGRQWLAGVRTDLEALGYAVGAADLAAASVGAPHIRQRLFWVADADRSRQRSSRGGVRHEWHDSGGGRADDPWSDAGGVADAHGGESGDRGLPRGREHGQQPTDRGPRGVGDADGRSTKLSWEYASASPDWADAVWLPCLDGKARRTQPGLCPLAHGVPARASQLRAYGNAIVPHVAAVFLRAYLDVKG